MDKDLGQDSRSRRRLFEPAGDPLARWALAAPEPHRAAALWALAVGAEIRRRSRIESCDPGGRLRIAVLDETWRTALEEMQGELLDRLNGKAGRRLYHRIRFTEMRR